MDGLSGAASGIAVVSLAFQLAESIKKLCEFWDSVQDAPNDIRAIVKELRLLSAVLEGIQLNELRYGPDPITRSVLESCADKVSALVSLVDDLEPGFASMSRRVRKWSAFKATLRSEKIKKFRASLEETKITLILARQNSSDRATGINFDRIDAQQRSLLDITHNIAGIQMQQSSRTVTTVSSGPADIDGHINDLRAETRRISSSVTNPILRCGFEMGVNNAYEGLKRHIGTQSSMETHWPAKHPVCSNEKVSGTEHCDDDPDGSAALVQGEPARTTCTIKRTKQKRSHVRYEVDEYSSEAENMLGKICFTTKTFHLRSQRSADLDACHSDTQYQFETSFTLHPAPWLIRCGVNFGLRVVVARSIQGWKQKLESYRAVPDSSKIFTYCSEGNLDGVRSLFSSGMASSRDTNSYGCTPLHYAAFSSRLQVCELLIDSGADQHARAVGPFDISFAPVVPRRAVQTNSLSSPVEMMTLDRIQNHSEVEDSIAVIRLLGDDVDFSEEDSNGWKILDNLARFAKVVEIMAWALEYFQTDIRQSSNVHHMARWLEDLPFRAVPGRTQLVEAILTLNSDVVHAPLPRNNCSALHYELLNGGDTSIMKQLAVRGANLHLTSRLSLLAEAETPTSLAMQRSYRFSQWRKLLIEMGKDLKVFVEEELQQSPLVIAGWKQDTLLALFTFQFEPCEPGGKECCAKCRSYFFRVEIQELWWERLLQRIKTHRMVSFGREDNEAPLWEGERSCRFCHEPEENIYHRQGESFCKYCHIPGDDAYHEEGERSCYRCRWKLGRTGEGHFLEDLNDKQLRDVESSDNESIEEYFSPLHVHF